MIKNYLRIAWRSMVKNRANSVINITGLAIGLSCFLLITLYVIDETSYEHFYPNKERIFRINSNLRFGGADMKMAQSPDVMGPLLKKDYPQVEQYTRIYTSDGSKLIKRGDDFINESKVASVDSTFFTVFQLPAIAGDTRHALDKPNTVVLTQTAANKYFGTEDVLGKTLQIKVGQVLHPYKVTAIVEDIPVNSHFHFDLFFSMANVDYNWGAVTSHNFYTYLLLKRGVDYHAFEKNFTDYIKKYAIPYARKYMNISSLEEFEKSGNKLGYSLIPLTDIHLYSHQAFELSPGGNIQYVYIFSAVALFILIIACINFMNLTTARSGARAREVGIRKVLGTERKQLITQFLLESILMVVLALVLAIIIDLLAISAFNNLASKKLKVSTLLTAPYILLLIILPLVVGVIAGSYPAFYLSRFSPIQVLKGKFSMGVKSSRFRNLLVVFQFSTSIILIIATIVVFRQLNYIHTKNIGFAKDQVLVIKNAGSLSSNTEAFKNEVLKLPEVTMATYSGYLPVSDASRGDNTYSTDPVMTAENGFSMQNWDVDYEYIATLGMHIKEGRNFSKSFGADSTGMIINEAAAKFIGARDPVGQFIYGSDMDGNIEKYHVIGVVKDFNYESLHSRVGPLCLLLNRNTYAASFKISTANANLLGLVTQIKGIWKGLAPEMPFNYRFLDNSFDDMYRAESRAGTIAVLFSSLAIFIACLGLFGLVMFAVEQRTKEIGVRKVLGASNTGIVQLLSKEFIKLIIVSFIVAAPIGWFMMNRWLQNYAYRTSMTWWIFAVAGGAAFIIALITVSFQSIKAARANPVKILKTD